MTISFWRNLTLALFAGFALTGCNRQVDLGPVANADASKAIREALLAGGAKSDGAEAGPLVDERPVFGADVFALPERVRDVSAGVR